MLARDGSAIGPALEYEIKKLTRVEMVLATRIEGANIENTTTFDRVGDGH